MPPLPPPTFSKSFFNLIKTQFQNQPAVSGKAANLPNERRKILIFSDSRQRAAVLARDMSKISEDIAARQLFSVAANEMELTGKNLSLSEFYGYFCLAAARNNVEHENFLTECLNVKRNFDRTSKRGRKFRPQLSLENSQTQM